MTNPNEFNRKALLQQVLDQFKLNRDGYHGPSHWARVRVHALEIGQLRGADLLVVELFAFLHDSQRHSEGTDYQHGQRAADYAASLKVMLMLLWCLMVRLENSSIPNSQWMI
jgi:uncharacterized protein